jgi:hypothetical protein
LNQEYQGFDRPLFYWYATGHVLQHLNELVKSLDTVHLGFSLGIPLLENHDPGAAALLRSAWESAGVKPPVHVVTTSNAGPVEAVVHARGREDERLIYVLNWGHHRADVKAELPWPGQTPLQGKDVVSGHAVVVEHKQNRAVFSLDLPPDRAAAVHITP